MQVTGRVLENEAFKAKCARICKRSPARKRPGPGLPAETLVSGQRFIDRPTHRPVNSTTLDGVGSKKCIAFLMFTAVVFEH